MQRLATGLLVLALVVFLVARWYESRYPWLGFLRATAEAAVVGGLADWFAVTALFRRPLGLPIPHTAIIPRQKDRIGQLLGHFVQKHFLNRDVLSARLGEMQLGLRLGEWVREPAHAAQLARGVASGMATAVDVLPQDEVSALVRGGARRRLQAVELAPLLADVLARLATDERRHDFLEGAVRLLSAAVEDGAAVRATIHRERPWWVPSLAEGPLTRRVTEAVRRVAAEVREDPAHPLRRKFDAAVSDLIGGLRESPELRARAESLKEDLLAQPVVDGVVASLWDQAREAATRYAMAPESVSLAPLERGIRSLGDTLLARPEVRVELDRVLADAVVAVLERQREVVAALIADTVRQWDPGLAAERIELAVGRDLQFIRLNGTLVGGLAGLMLYALGRLLD